MIPICRLMLATFAGKVDAVQLLKENGADHELRDKGGSTALHWAVDGQSIGENLLCLLTILWYAMVQYIRHIRGRKWTNIALWIKYLHLTFR